MCKKFSDYLTVDHIFPVSLLVRFGLTENSYKDRENMELICRNCNILKQDRFDFNNPKTVPLIKHYLELIIKTYSKPMIEEIKNVGEKAENIKTLLEASYLKPEDMFSEPQVELDEMGN